MSGGTHGKKSFFQWLGLDFKKHATRTPPPSSPPPTPSTAAASAPAVPPRSTKISDERKKTLRCSFCNKEQTDVKKLIAGPCVYICEECVDICNDILAEGRIPGGRGLKVGMRTAAVVQEQLRTARVLLENGETTAAARQTKSAAVATLRALLVIAGDDPDRTSTYLIRDADRERWDELNVIVNSLRSCPEVSELLHSRDAAHIILRSTLEHAGLSANDVATAMAVVSDLLSLVLSNADSAAKHE